MPYWGACCSRSVALYALGQRCRSVRVFVGVPSYNRAKVLRLCLSSFSNSKLVKGFIVVADSTSKGEAEHYAKVVKEVMNCRV